jgi:hypothetical protein
VRGCAGGVARGLGSFEIADVDRDPNAAAAAQTMIWIPSGRARLEGGTEVRRGERSPRRTGRYFFGRCVREESRTINAPTICIVSHASSLRAAVTV